MHMPCWTSVLLGTTLVLALAIAVSAVAETPAAPAAPAAQKAPGFPADYKGTPFKGVAQEIPGRVELENFDEGGLNVGFATQHHEGDSSGKDYRTGDKPQICVTNAAPGEQDKFVDGKRYPAEGKESYYIGYTRPGDWVKCTVNVKKAGVYRVSTTAANETKKMTFSLSFNDVKKAEVNADGTGSYHIWKLHENVCTVKLDAGLQVMLFKIGSEPHMNYDYLEFVLDEKAAAATPEKPAAPAAPAPATK
jgi:arabinoxylan arabinofuranohydrolase